MKTTRYGIDPDPITVEVRMAALAKEGLTAEAFAITDDQLRHCIDPSRPKELEELIRQSPFKRRRLAKFLPEDHSKAGGNGYAETDTGRIDEAIRRCSGTELPNGDKPIVHLSADLDADLRKCERELILSPHVDVYQRAGCIVRRGTAKGKNHEGKAVTFGRIARHNVHSLRAVMAQAITFLAAGKLASPCHPPKEYARLLLDHPEKDYPILRGLISAPTLRADGSILDKPGYDKQTGLFFDPKGGVFCPIPANPTKDDALAALKELLEPIAKFPFVDEASKSVQLARMLTGVCRTALFTSPLFGYTAPSARTGKSMLVDIACILSHGHVAPVVVASSAFEELDKQLQAMISSGDTIIALDNQDTDEALESNLLCQMLTQPVVKIRPFGQNQDMLDFPSLSVISVTGNNLAIAKDLTERTILCSLDAKMEIPGSRKFNFSPVAMALKNRAQLVRACLIVLKAYVVAGRPTQDITPMGGFEDWSDLVRSSLVWLGAADPCTTGDKIRASDQSRGLQITIMDLWAERFGNAEMSAGDAVKAAQAGAELGNGDLLAAFWCTAKKSAKNLPMALGKWLNSKDGVVIGRRRFVASGRQGHLKFRLHSMEEPTA
jgi:putative DNA primase/helicase